MHATRVDRCLSPPLASGRAIVLPYMLRTWFRIQMGSVRRGVIPCAVNVALLSLRTTQHAGPGQQDERQARKSINRGALLERILTRLRGEIPKFRTGVTGSPGTGVDRRNSVPHPLTYAY